MQSDSRASGMEAAQRILNPVNDLVVHRVATGTDSELIDGALELTRRSFEHEPIGVVGMKNTYNALLQGESSQSGEDLGEFYIYSLPQHGSVRRRVVAQSGFYRNQQAEEGMQNDGARLLAFMRRLTPLNAEATIKTLGLCDVENPTGPALDRLNECFLWGGRFSVDESVRSSPRVMPFIIQHIFEEAYQIVSRKHLLPILFGFTQSIEPSAVDTGGVATRDSRRAMKVHEFYRSLHFENTGCTLRYNSILEDVLGVSLLPGAPIWKRLQRLKRGGSL